MDASTVLVIWKQKVLFAEHLKMTKLRGTKTLFVVAVLKDSHKTQKKWSSV